MRRLADSLKIEPGPDSDVLLVEGEDDFFAMKNLFVRTGLIGKIRIDEGGGYDRLRDSVDTRLDGSGLERIGVIVDADDDLSARWMSIRSAFVNVGYDQMPLQPDSTGTIVEVPGRPTVGIWIMPDNQLPGELEDFIRLLIPDNDNLWGRAMAAVSAIPIDERLFGESVTKAQLHTWLAWQSEPGKPIGQAIIKRYFSTETAAAYIFRNWLSRLYSVDVPAAA